MPTPAGRGGIWFPRGHILHDYLESRVMPVVTGPIGRGNLQYTAMWKAAQRFTEKPVKFGAVSAEIVTFALQDRYYKSMPERMFAIADAFNEEYHELADAGCPVIQIEEPQIHLIAVRKIQDSGDHAAIDRRRVQPHGERPARQDRSVGAFLLGQSVAATNVRGRCRATSRRWRSTTRSMPTSSPSSRRAPAASTWRRSARPSPRRRSRIGVIDHHTLQVEQPEQVAAQIRAALKYIPAERLMVSTDCGMGREGMSRRHAFYKAVAITLGTNIVRKELGVPEARVPAADERYSLVVPAK